MHRGPLHSRPRLLLLVKEVRGQKVEGLDLQDRQEQVEGLDLDLVNDRAVVPGVDMHQGGECVRSALNTLRASIIRMWSDSVDLFLIVQR